MGTKEEIEALTGLDLSSVNELDDDARRAVEGTVYDALWHVANAGACSFELAEELTARLHKALGGRAVLHAS